MNIFRCAIVIALLYSGYCAQACDVCACGTGGAYMGILPQFTRNFAGVRFSSRAYFHPLTELNKNGSSVVKSDKMYSEEFWVRLYPKPRIQVIANIPFRHHVRSETERITRIHGLGDLSFSGNYILLNTADSLYASFRHTLSAGAGFRMPTGKYQQRDVTKLMLPASFQTGTGAWAATLNLIHTMRFKSLGLNTNVQYMYSGKNELDYKFGNAVTATLSVFYWKKNKNMSMLPSLGISLEKAQSDYQYKVIKEATGGEALLFVAGADFYFGRSGITSFVQLPLNQKLPYAQPTSGARFGVGYTFFLK